MLLIPASNAGKQLGEAITSLFPDIKFVRVPGQADLMFLREQNSLTAADLRPLLRARLSTGWRVMPTGVRPSPPRSTRPVAKEVISSCMSLRSDEPTAV